ncbi:uncharacterized protein LOC106153907 [Lingula anatina]|uniref:Uncharacterized protein LOC106153907 n=1 Tax=Lingula anatina TaxID=7574 RepID=A0A1S3HEP6_LINAN|nr:uncharacterized protein LOC106153907 [Lingula anatina]|eukprot:XP_013383509.1 uncharacterized protein LOC106153907 [Lingula anatina]
MNLKMAGSSEGDILAHVQRTITEFPESSEPDNNDHDESVENQPPRGLVNLVETQGQIFTTDDGEDGPGDLKAKYLKEIAELEQEVALLEEEYMYKQTVEGLQLSWDQLELILQCVESSSSSNYEEARKEKAETLKEQVKAHFLKSPFVHLGFNPKDNWRGPAQNTQ